MKTTHTSPRTVFSLRRLSALILALAGSALLFGIFSPRLAADPTGTNPTIHFTQGVLGKQVCLQWDAQPGVQYVVQKTATLQVTGAPGGSAGFKRVALVTAGGTTCQWVDPETPGATGFYRIEIPAAQVFALEPPVLSTAGGTIFVRAQCLPPGSFLQLEIPGRPPVLAELVPVAGQPGLWRAVISAGQVAGITGGVVAARVVDSNGVTVALVDQTIEVTGNGFASDAPSGLPPAAPVAVLKTKTKSNQSNDRMAGGGENQDEDCDSPDFQGSLLMPALMKAKEKANRTKCSNNLRQAGLPGEVTLEVCPLSLDTPAGPALDCVLTYRSMVPSGSASSFGSNWTGSYDISVTPVPLAAGSSATRLRVCDGSGRCDTYVRQADDSFTCDGMFRTGRFTGNTFTLTFADHGKWVFRPLDGSAAQGKIASICDRNNVALACTYAPDGLLTAVASPFGQSLTFTHSLTGAISRVTDHTGRYCDFTYFSGGQAGGNDGLLQACSCPQVGGVAPVAGPTTFTYTTGCAVAQCDNNLLSCRDGAGRLLCSYTYSSSTNPLAVDFDRVVSSRCSDSPAVTSATRTYTAVSGGLLVSDCDELGRVTETTCDRQHRPVQERAYTGFSVAGVPVTPASNRPAGQLRAGDPPYYQTTCAYNAQHCVTVCTEPDGLQTRSTYQYDISGAACPISERGNERVRTLVSPGGEQRTVSMTYLPGFGAQEPGSSKYNRVKVQFHWDRYSKDAARVVNPNGAVSNGSFKFVMPFTVSGGDASVLGRGRQVTFTIAQGATSAVIPGKSDRRSVTIGWRGEECDAGNPSGDEIFRAVGMGMGKATVGMGMGKGMYSWMKASFDKRSVAGAAGEASAGKIKKFNVELYYERFCTSLTTTYGQTFTDSYDARGNCTSSRTPIAGAGEDCVYNSLGQLTSVTTLNGPGSSFLDECVYDPATHFCTSMVSDGTGLHLTVSCARDALGRVTSETDERGFDTLFTYNPLDECVTVQSPVVGTDATAASRITTTCFYDAGGLPSGCDVEHRDATGTLVATNPAYSTRYLRESAVCPLAVSRAAVENRPVSLPPGSLEIAAVGLENFDVCDFTFDACGQCVEERTPAVCRAQPTDAVCSYQFDERGMLYRAVEGLAGTLDAVTTQCDYTPGCDLGRCATLASTAAESPTETYLYDGFRRCVSSTDPMGNVLTFTYNNQGYVTCDLYGELDDVAGSAGNILLARRKAKTSEATVTMASLQFQPEGTKPGRRYGGQNVGGRNASLNVSATPGGSCAASLTGRPVGQPAAAGLGSHVQRAFFDYCTEDETCTVERFTPGSAAPHALDITTVDCSPAGLVMNVSTNGDLLVSNTYDTAARPVTCANGACTVAMTLDACGNVIACTRTDLSSAGGSSHVGTACATTYNSIGLPVQMSEGSNVTACDFDSLGRAIRCSPATGAPIVYEYDGGTPAQPYSVRVRCDVDGDGSLETLGSSYARFTVQNNGDVPTSRFTVTNMGGVPSGTLRSVTNSNGFTTTLTRDSQDRCVQTDFPDGTHESSAFDNLGRMVSHTRKNGAIIAANYDLNDRVISSTITDPDPQVVPVPTTTYHYSGMDDCVRLTQGASDVVCSFDSCDNLLSESQNGHLVQHTYTHRGHASTGYPDGSRYNEVRNAQGLLLSCSAEGSAGPVIFSVLYQGYRPVEETRANGVVTSYLYRGPNDDALPGTGADLSIDACVQTTVTGPTGTVLSRTTYSRDASQFQFAEITRFSAADAPSRIHFYVRDNLHRITRERIFKRATPGGPFVVESDERFTLDLEGQRLTATGGAHPGTYTSDDALPPGDRQMNQYSTWPEGGLAYDSNGSLTLFSHGTAGGQQLVYDACSRLVAVVDNGTGATVATYGYDACDRLVSRSLASSDPVNPPETTFFIYDGGRCIQELDSNGTPQTTFAAMGLCIVPINGDPIYPHGGSASADIIVGAGCGAGPHIRLLTASTGAPVEHFDCDQAGQPIFLTSEGVLRQGATTALTGYKWMTPECLWCPESGLFMCDRCSYSPALGLCTSRTFLGVKPGDSLKLSVTVTMTNSVGTSAAVSGGR